MCACKFVCVSLSRARTCRTPSLSVMRAFSVSFTSSPFARPSLALSRSFSHTRARAHSLSLSLLFFLCISHTQRCDMTAQCDVTIHSIRIVENEVSLSLCLCFSFSLPFSVSPSPSLSRSLSSCLRFFISILV